ncbi:MAG: polyprenyl synthetase family protein [Acidobacteria bacterium]|nr:MAG: polyprenyl synthetase family protein [Acidobacteriota bacterium]
MQHGYERELSLVRGELLKHLDPDVKDVLEVGSYILSSGGKRIRPLLTLLTCRTLGGDEERALPLAIGIEYVHVASLLHDDVVDGAEFRRGKKSANLLFGNEVCVLTGDYMYAKALSLYAKYGDLRCIDVLSDAVMKMSQGQLLELKNLGRIIDEDTYFKIVDYKTGALFGACMAVGALMSGREDYWDFYKVGTRVGRAFQLVDDALDYSGDEEKLGKPTGLDLSEGKCTYPLIAVVDRLREDQLGYFFNGMVEELRELVLELGGVEKTVKRANEEIEEVLKFLEGFDKDGILKELLPGVAARER